LVVHAAVAHARRTDELARESSAVAGSSLFLLVEFFTGTAPGVSSNPHTMVCERKGFFHHMENSVIDCSAAVNFSQPIRDKLDPLASN
jgi:hypothetical protein